MIAKLLPLALGLAGLGAGVGAGLMLRPDPEPVAPSDAEIHDEQVAQTTPKAAADSHDNDHDAGDVPSEFANLNNQFVFPLIEQGDVVALVVLSLTLEVAGGQTEAVFAREPKLQDGFLRVLLDHANVGGFRGAFTSNDSMERLRRALLEKGREILGDALFDVLILNINRQDV